MGKKVNQTELAEIFGVTDVTLWSWQKDGMPILTVGGQGKANEYDTEACISWYVQREKAKVSSETQRDRLARLQGDKLETEMKLQAGTLVPGDQIEPIWRSRVMAAAAFLLGQPSRLAGILDGTPGVDAKRKILRQELTSFLDHLGVEGEAMQAELEGLLEKVGQIEASAFIARISARANVQPDVNPDPQ